MSHMSLFLGYTSQSVYCAIFLKNKQVSSRPASPSHQTQCEIMETINVFNETFKDVIEANIKSIVLENTEDTTEVSPIKKEEKKNVMSCSYCKVTFVDIPTQREHYKLDWHRFNLKQSLQGRSAISELEFNQRNEKDDISSISGSDSENEDTLDTFATAQGQIFLQNSTGRILSLHKCLVFNRKDEIDDTVLERRLKSGCVSNKQWGILMLGGGHFAGAIFNGTEAILHKTFHCYTVRQGQGGSQSSRDNKSGGSHPKSAGASLRRYNEQSLIQHVQDIAEQWKEELGKCSLVFYRAPGPYNRAVLFGGQAPILQRADERLRNIPFSTRRATFTEVKRVHQVLTSAQLYENLETVIRNLEKRRSQNRDTKRSKIKTTNINRAKSREVTERPLPTKHSSETNSLANSISEHENDEITLTTSELEISFDHLKEFEDTEKSNRRKRKPKKSKTQKDFERKNEITTIIQSGNLIKLKELLENDLNPNEVLDDGNTLMHIAALNEQCAIVQYLLEINSDPCLKNKKSLTPYSCTNSKLVRDSMKEFAKDNPDKYNYNKAQIPTNTLTADELAEKKRLQRKLKREKEKIKKEENKVKQKEEDERERYLQLSDREKRALAAERRILDQKGTVTSRCFLCGSDISGKVPFEYSNNRFCSMECLKAHRLSNKSVS